ASARTARIGESLELAGNCVVFSNELFDAQPFRRFVVRDDSWTELGVQLRDDGLVEVELATPAPPELPSGLPNGYRIDVPFAASELLQRIAAQNWQGLFVACDYGKTWRELTEACPEGTARAYFRHQQSNDLLARPGEQDLTCHICWDWLATTLKDHRFAKPSVDSQESFLIRHAAKSIAAISAAEALRFSRRKASLLQLLHPAHMGQKFQVLHALRD
ncbi:MAG TPA: SAM-dependent methyltransferase, partial [Opitutus sp.]|nr:SAM-dependent methyltransferase [Opitutus sp.]